jgi:hypothetical protein
MKDKPEAMHARQKRWRENNKERAKVYNRAYRRARPEWVRRVRGRNKDAERRYRRTNRRRHSVGLTDKYITKLLVNSKQYPSKENLELCRQRIQIQRSQKLLKLMAAASQLSSLSAI